MISDAEERSLREEHGYNDAEIETVKQSRLYAKMADDLRAQAAQSAYRRAHPNGPDKASSDE